MVILLARYGWLAFIASVLVYVALFVCVFTMVTKTKQSSFAKYTSLLLSLSLLIQATYSLISLLLLDCSHINMPYMGGLTMNLINYISFAIILTLYLKREQPSKIKEIEIDNEETCWSKLKNFLKYDDFDVKEIDEDFDDTDFADFEEFMKNEEAERRQHKSFLTRLRENMRSSIEENEEDTEDQ